jgi:catechol 2,3-dioxygenase-like lactoylglutathione lyase family enzyme
MSTIKCNELVYIRRQVPDLAKAKQFLIDFGLIPCAETADAIYLRGTDAAPHCYILHQGPLSLLGFAFQAKNEGDLHELAAATGRQIERIDEPGGGMRVRLHEPNGYAVDVVYGIETQEPIRVERQPANTANSPLARAGTLLRLPQGQPTPVKRIAHVVLGTPIVSETSEWFARTLGFVASDEVFGHGGSEHIASFLRVDKGDDYVDHHAFLPMRSAATGLHHVSFEAQDIDAVMADHHFLKSRGYDQLWGIGRHLLGSQLFDYWNDPFGHAHEHWADSDRLNVDAPTGVWDVKEGLTNQWGEPPSDRFRNNVKP